MLLLPCLILSLHAAEPAPFNAELGGPQRTGLMPSLPDGKLASYERQSSHVFDLEVENSIIVDQWKTCGSNPAGGLRFADSRVFLQNADRMIGLQTDDLSWQFKLPSMGYPSPWQFDRPSLGRVNVSEHKYKNLFFFDHSAAASLVDNDTLYFLERPTYDPMYRMWMRNRPQVNQLAAYSIPSGKVPMQKWIFDLSGGSFLGEPVLVDDLLFAPFLQTNQLGVVAVEAATGKPRWQTIVGASGNINPFISASIAVEGDDIYMLPGNKSLSCLDLKTGALQWRMNYPQDLSPRPIFTWSPRLKHGIKTDSKQPTATNWMLTHDDLLICMPSDGEIFCIDRTTRKLEWVTFRYPKLSKDLLPTKSYPLGIAKGALFLGSSNAVLRYRLKGGRLDASAQLNRSLGRGMITAEGIYMPDGGDICLFDFDLKRLERASFSTDEPLGNLYSDGKRLYHRGPYRVDTFTPPAE